MSKSIIGIAQGGTGGATAAAALTALGAYSATNPAGYVPAANPTFNGVATIPYVFINRAGTPASGISWYSTSHNTWSTYMGQAGFAGQGPRGTLTPVAGAIVSSWGLRSFIENSTGYGWVWESGISTGNGAIMAEISAVNGNAKFLGEVAAKNFTSAASTQYARQIQLSSVPAPTATVASVAVTNGNLHIDPCVGSFATYLSFYAGTGGTKFGNGASGIVAEVNSAGAFSGTSFNGSGAGLTGTAPSLTAGALSNFTVGGRSSADLNSLVGSGTYGFENNPPNNPGGTAYGAMMVARNIDTGLQIAGGYLCDALYFRGFGSTGGVFTSWRSVVHSGNINSQAVMSANKLTGPASTNGTDGWFRSVGTTGWYNSDFAVGIYATEAGYVRTYNNAHFTANNVYANGSFNGAGTGLTGYAAGFTAAAATNAVAATQMSPFGSAANANTQFTDTPAFRRSWTEVNASANAPNGGWWMLESIRHSNASNFWGIQYAHGWDSNANRTLRRNVGAGVYGPWYEDLTTANYNSYSPTLSGQGASGTWGISISGNSAYATTAGNANSISNAIGAGYAWTGTQQFKTNKGAGSYGGSTNTYTQFLSDDLGAAGFSFHRAGAYAVNMTLDPDNVIRIGGWSAQANVLQCDMGGNLTMLGNVTAYSDERLKKDIAPIKSALSKLLQLTGVTYNRKDNGQAGRGFVAQEVQKFYPELVHQAGDSDMLSVAYANFAGDFVEALREVNDRMKAIEAKQVEIEQQAAVQAQQVNDRLAALEAKFN